jgi:hypothetical protein
VGGYVRQFDVTVTHDGEPITATLKPAKAHDVLSLQGVDRTNVFLINAFQEKLAESIVELKGPLDAAGVQVSKEEFLGAAYFMSAVMQMGSEWLRRAMPQNPPSPGE